MFQCDSMLENQNTLHSRLQEKSAGHDVKHHEDFDTLLGLYVLFLKIYLFIYLFLRYVGLSPLWPLLLRSTGSGRAGSAAMAHGPAAPLHVGSSQTGVRTLSLIHI